MFILGVYLGPLGVQAAALEAIRLAELARLADEEEEARRQARINTYAPHPTLMYCPALRRAIMEADRRALLAQQAPVL